MAAGLTPEQALEIETASGGKIELAAINTPSSVTLAGDEEVLLALQREMDEQKVSPDARFDYAFHSHLLDPVHDYFAEAAGAVETSTLVPFYRPFAHTQWRAASLMPPTVGHAQACAVPQCRHMIADGIDVLVEIGPH